ncbi:MAG TPA: hypothetical protein VKA26_15530 [Ignavibacteriaceae bacterium]|nr:hypothetical protein [Ignavibacteriaceae bacterium]
MQNKYFNMFLRLSAFLLPVYFIFYPPLNDTPRDPFIKSLWWFTIAGFCFYGILALVIFVF